MAEVIVLVGKIEHGDIGQLGEDKTRQVSFEGRVVGEYMLTDSTPPARVDRRGVVKTLYCTTGGRLILHTETWVKATGAATTYSLVEVSKEALQPGGEHEMVGRVAGFGQPKTLEEELGKKRIA